MTFMDQVKRLYWSWVGVESVSFMYRPMLVNYKYNSFS